MKKPQYSSEGPKDSIEDDTPLLRRLSHHFSEPKAKRQELLERSVEALERLDYLQIASATDEDGFIRVRLSSIGWRPVELVRSDIRLAWKSLVARSKTSLHLMRATPQGFDFRFSILEDGVFLTGVYEVTVDDPADLQDGSR